MTSKRIGIIAAGAMAGALLLGTAGLAAAQDPNAAPGGSWGAGMMNGAGMMGGSGMTGGAGMMGGSGMTGGAGMMGGSGMTMTTEQLAQMDVLHDQMVASGACTQAQMQQLHAQHHPSN